MTQASTRPPRLAVWLIELFAPDEQAASVLGDLLEEFSEVAAKSSIADARRWYWRQTLPTVFHLLRSGLRAAPWAIAGGIVLVEFGWWFMGWSSHQVMLFLSLYLLPHIVPRSHFQALLVVLLLNSGHYLYRLGLSMLIGCTVALLSKGREIATTFALALICSFPTLTRFWFFFSQGNTEPLRHWLTWAYFFGGLVALVAGGAIVRSRRLRSLHTARS